MSNIPAPAENKCSEYILAKPEDLFVACLIVQCLCDRRQQLHFDVNIPTETVVMPEIVYVIVTDHIRMVFHIRIMRVYLKEIRQIIVEVVRNIGIIISFIVQCLNEIIIWRDGQHLQSGLLLMSEHIPLDLIYSAEAAPADQPYRLPARTDYFLACSRRKIFPL